MVKPEYSIVNEAYNILILTGVNIAGSLYSLTPILLTILLFVFKFGITQVYQEYPVEMYAGTSCVLNRYAWIIFPYSSNPPLFWLIFAVLICGAVTPQPENDKYLLSSLLNVVALMDGPIPFENPLNKLPLIQLLKSAFKLTGSINK